MLKKAVFCIATCRNQADRIVDQLKTANFPKDDIFVLSPHKQIMRDFWHMKNTRASEGAAVGVRTGGVMGCALGWIVGIGALTIPEVGPLNSAGPIVAALGGAAIGATVGAVVGGVIGLRIPEAGIHLISVHTEDLDEMILARDIFTKAGAKDIRSLGKACAARNDNAAYRASYLTDHALG